MMLAPALIWYRQAGDPGIYFSPAAPPGQLLYVLSKLAGMYALLLATLQLILGFMNGLGLTTVSAPRRLHALIGAGVVVLALAHAVLFFSAVSLRQGDPAWGLLAPDFKDFYHSHLSFGLFAVVLLLGVMFTGFMRSGRRSSFARRLHRSSVAAIPLGYLHALAIGTESQSLAGLLLFGVAGAAGLLMLTAWMLLPRRKKQAAS
jgi:DMSO/TMAO reductase YedYZ heme-binding membrane subunit